MELFGIFKNAPRVRKFSAHNEIQTTLQEAAQEQIDAFMSASGIFDFNGRYKPDINELLKISDFDDIDDLIGSAKEPDGVPQWTLEEDNNDDPFDDLKALFFFIKRNDRIIIGIQNFDKRQIISDKLSFIWNRDCFRSIGGNALSLDTKLCALLEENEDNTCTLYFKSLHNARRIFDMDDYYNTATIEEIQTFFNNESFHGYNHEWLLENNDNTIRRKVTLITNEGVLDAVTPEQIKTHADSVSYHIETVEIDGVEKLVFPTEKRSLKRLLRFLDEDIFLTPFTRQLCITNSRRTL